MSDFELKWEIYELPQSSCVYWVKGTRIQKLYGLFPNPDEGFYPTYNAAKRAVARYRRESEDYWYSCPGSVLKNTKKHLKIYIEKQFEKDFETFVNAKTIKIRKLRVTGLQHYKRIKLENKE